MSLLLWLTILAFLCIQCCLSLSMTKPPVFLMLMRSHDHGFLLFFFTHHSLLFSPPFPLCHSHPPRRQEVEALEAIGHKRLLLLTGEHPKYSFERFLEAVQVVSMSFFFFFEYGGGGGGGGGGAGGGGEEGRDERDWVLEYGKR